MLPVPPLPPAGVVVVVEPRPGEVVVGVEDFDGVVAVEVSAFSSEVNRACAESKLDWADDTDSDRAVVERVARVSPAVTVWPTAALSVFTCPPTWKAAEASLTGATVPTRSRLFDTEARTTLAMR